MKQDRAMTAIGVLTVLMGLLMLSVGKFIMGGIVMLLAFGIFWTRGGGKFNDRSIYEKVVKTDLGIDELYEKIKDIDTPFGKPWIAVHKGYEGDSIIFGPGKFKDMVAISRVKDSLSIKHLTLIENIIRGEEDEYRFRGERKMNTDSVISSTRQRLKSRLRDTPYSRASSLQPSCW